MIAPMILVPSLLFMPLDEKAIKPAIEKGLERLQTAATSYTKNRSCFSCHHQAMPMLTFAVAKKHGYAIDDAVMEKQRDFTLAFFKERVKQLDEGRNIGGGSTTVVYGLIALKAAGHPRDEVTDALTGYLRTKQTREGTWPSSSNRPPSQGSALTHAGLALDTLNHFTADSSDELKDKTAAVYDKALKGLRSATLDSTEDRVFHLWGLISAKADADEVAKARDELLKLQRPDGGWAQLPDMASDAYATGSVLYALRLAGLPAEDARVKKAMHYLLVTQGDTGGWVVKTRARPVQTYFDNGDPGGKSQFISTAATAWCIAALIECEPPRTQR